jgi:SAM-dependent methyltransferase
MKKALTDATACLECGAKYALCEEALSCVRCGARIPLENGVPVFTPSPPGLQPSEKLARGPHIGTPWRQANWRFLSETAGALPLEALILDVGAGRGDFASLFDRPGYLAVDVYPYPELDLACDLTQTNPFHADHFDAILLLNVLEHLFDAPGLLNQLFKLLKPGGILVVAIPFMVKLHQAPLDYARYTQFALLQIGEAHGFIVERLEGFYDPVSLLGEGVSNLKYHQLPRQSGWQRYALRLVVIGLEALTGAVRKLLGPGKVLPAAVSRNPAPTGYHVVYRKPYEEVRS